MPTAAEPELGFLLEAVQLGHHEISEQFDEAARPILRRMARRHGYGLPKDALEDVVQEALAAIVNPDLAPFKPVEGTASQYLLGKVFNAAKTTQVAYGLRRNGSDFENEPRRKFLPIDDQPLTSPSRTLDAIEARATLDKIFAGVDCGTKDACIRVLGDDETQSEVAADLQMSRFKLARVLSSVRTVAMQYA